MMRVVAVYGGDGDGGAGVSLKNGDGGAGVSPENEKCLILFIHTESYKNLMQG